MYVYLFLIYEYRPYSSSGTAYHESERIVKNKKHTTHGTL